MPTIWLVVVAYLDGQMPMLIDEAQQPNIPACLDRAATILEGAAKVAADAGFEIAVTCSVAKGSEQPAKESR